MGSTYKNEDIEDWKCFEMDYEGHLLSMIHYQSNFQLSNESIEHLSNFPHLINLHIFFSTNIQDSVTNFSLLSKLSKLSMRFEEEFQNPELFKDLGLFISFLYICLAIMV